MQRIESPIMFEEQTMNKVIFGDCRDSMRQMITDGVKVQMCVTSPPYFNLRDYGHPGQIGLEATPDEFIAKLVEVFSLVRELLADDGILWVNIGDSYAANRSYQVPDTKHIDVGNNKGMMADSFGLKPKDLMGIPWMLAFALRADGWYLRQDIIWSKPNPMPESVTDRCTKSHEYIFLLSRSEKYYYNHEAIKVPVKQDWGTRDRKDGKYHNEGTGLNPHSGLEKSYEKANKRSVWEVATQPYFGAHFATYPPALIEPCILAGSRVGDIVIDPFFGSGTSGQVAQALGRKWIGCELNPEYADLQKERVAQQGLIF